MTYRLLLTFALSAGPLLLLTALLPAGQHPGGEPVFVAYTADGKEVEGTPAKFADDWSVRLAGDRPALIAGRDLLSLERPRAVRPPHPTGPQVVLSNGDRLPLDLSAGIRISHERLRVRPGSPLRPAGADDLRIPLPYVEAVWLAAPEGTVEAERALRRLLGEKRTADVVLLRNGDRIEGVVTGIDSGGDCTVEVAKKPARVPFGRVAAVAFHPELLARPRPKTPHAHAVFAGGARLTLLSAEVDRGRKTVTGKAVCRVEVAAPLGSLAALIARHDNVTYLSDLEPVGYEHTPFFSVSWPYARDASISGGALSLRGLGAFDRGVALHAGSRLTYALDGKYRWFEARAGMDPQGRPASGVRIGVQADGKECVKAAERERSPLSPPLRLRVDVAGAKRLTLLVEYGSGGDVQAHFNWCEARLLR